MLRMAIKVTETIYYCTDLDRACAFYAALGWKLVEKQAWGWAAFEIDGRARLGLLRTHDPEIPRPRVGIQTSDIAAEVANLRSLGVDVDELQGDAVGIRAVNFRDPDGNEVFLWDDGSGKL